MTGTDPGKALVIFAVTVAALTSCVSPVSWPDAEPAAEPGLALEVRPADERVSDLESQIKALEAENRALEASAAATEKARREAEQAALSAKEMASEARAETTRAQSAVATAEAIASEARAEAARAQSAATAAQADAGAAQKKVEAMMMAAIKAAADQPPALMVSVGQLDPRLLNFDAAQASVAGPDTVYVSSIKYAGDEYSAVLKYRGGTTATVATVFGPQGKLIPDSVDLTRTKFSFTEPDMIDISYVAVDGVGYSGRLRLSGDNQLEVVGIRRVAIPPTAEVAAARAAAARELTRAEAATVAALVEADAAAEAQAAAEARLAAAEARVAAEVAALQSEIDLLLRDAEGRPVMLPVGLDLGLLDVESAEVSRAAPDAIYLSRIGYGDQEYAALVRYTGDDEAILEALYSGETTGIAAMDFSTPAIAVVSPDELTISNVGIKGAAYSVSLHVSRYGTIAITTRDQGHRVRTAAELLRDDLLISADANRLVRGFRGGSALPDEGSWKSSGGAAVVRQTDVEASHAKFAIANVAQSAVPTLYGLTARVDGGERVGYGMHFLASETPLSGNTWNYGRSYLMWVTYEPGFFDSEDTQVQLYESLDDNQLVWRNSKSVAQSLSDGLTLEALYDPHDCPEITDGHVCHGTITVLVDGDEQFKVAVSVEIATRRADTVALRALGGPVEYTDIYVHSR